MRQLRRDLSGADQRAGINVDVVAAWERLVEELPLSLVAINASGEVTVWSKYAEQLYGWKREEAVGTDIMTLTVGPE